MGILGTLRTFRVLVCFLALVLATSLGPSAQTAQASAHPSLYYTQAELDVLRTLTTAPTHGGAWTNIQTWATAHISDPVPAYNGASVHQLVYKYMETMTFMYDMTGDTRYRDAAVRWMVGIAGWTNWRSSSGTNHWQSNSYVQLGMAIGYYAFKDVLRAADRSAILAAFTSSEKGGYEVVRYGGSLTNPRFGYSYFPSGFPNAESTVGAAIGISALALGADYANSSNWLAFGNAAVEYALGMGDSGGGWVEGPNYFEFSMQSLILYVDMYKRVSATDHFSKYREFLGNASRYAWYMTLNPGASQQKIQMEDTTRTTVWGAKGEPAFWYRLAREYDDVYAQEMGNDFATGTSVRDYVWLDASIPEGDHTTLPLTKMFSNIGYTVWRDSWDDSAATVVVFKSGRSVGHAHPNQNSFMVVKNGIQLTGGIGYLSSSYPNYRSSVLNNTISVGTYTGSDSNQYGYGQAQEIGADAWASTVPVGTSGRLTDVEAGSWFSSVTGDASDLYTGEVNSEPYYYPINSSGDATSVTRQMVWVPSTNYIVVYDAVELPRIEPVHFMANSLSNAAFTYDASSGTFAAAPNGGNLQIRPVVPSVSSTSHFTRTIGNGDYNRPFGLLGITSTGGASPRLVTVITPSTDLSTGRIATTAVNSGNIVGVVVKSPNYLDLILFSRDGGAASQYVELGGYYQSADGAPYTFSGTQVLASFTKYRAMRLAPAASGNRAPVLTNPGDRTVNEGATLSFIVSATDPDGSQLTYSASNLPYGSTFDPSTRMFFWVPASGQAGTYTGATFAVSDGTLSDSESITITVNKVNRPPVLNTIGGKAVNAGAALTFTVSATDPDGSQLTYSASNLPSGSTFDPSTRTFSWVPTTAQVGTYAGATFTVSDGTLSDSESITLTVNAPSAPSSADINTDGAVNILDMIRVSQHFGESGTNGWIPEDLNKDGTVNILDVNLVGQSWTG